MTKCALVKLLPLAQHIYPSPRCRKGLVQVLWKVLMQYNKPAMVRAL